MGGTLTEDRKAEMSADMPVGRVGTVDEIAALMAFLLGADAGYITAAPYVINGGLQVSETGGGTQPDIEDVTCRPQRRGTCCRHPTRCWRTRPTRSSCRTPASGSGPRTPRRDAGSPRSTTTRPARRPCMTSPW